jgi:NADH:ubiquinone reductase (non-electrogenic)
MNNITALRNINTYKEQLTNQKINKKTIHIVGFGWASIGFIKHIYIEIYNVIIISDNCVFNYTPLLAQNIKKNKNNLTFTINEINDKIEFNQNEVETIDFNKKIIATKEGFEIPYKHLIFAHGSTINTFNISGVHENTLFLKTYDDSEKIKKKLLELPNDSVIAVIGCGLTGSEIIGSLIDYNKFQIVAVDALSLPLTIFDKTLSNDTIDLWRQNSVKMYLNKCVSKINPKKIEFKGDNENIEFDLAIWCAGIKSSPLTETINKILQVNCNKGIPVNKYLQVENIENVYAIGDCAFSGYPPTAQVAYQQGKYLANQFNNRFYRQSKNKQSEFQFQNNCQICYIGNNKSVFQNSYFKSTGNITYYLNKVIHMYYLFTIPK